MESHKLLSDEFAIVGAVHEFGGPEVIFDMIQVKKVLQRVLYCNIFYVLLTEDVLVRGYVKCRYMLMDLHFLAK